MGGWGARLAARVLRGFCHSPGETGIAGIRLVGRRKGIQEIPKEKEQQDLVMGWCGDQGREGSQGRLRGY